MRRFACFVGWSAFAAIVLLPRPTNADNLFDTLFGKPSLEVEWTYQSGVFDESAAEICAFDKKTGRVFVTNSNTGTVDVLEAVSGDLIIQLGVGGDPTSVSAFDGLVAVAVPAEQTGDSGSVSFIDADSLKFKSSVEVGFLPDMLTFTPDGKYVVVANEGEPNDDYSIDPVGSVSIIKVNKGKNPTVKEASFEGFNDQKDRLIADGVRIFGPGASVAQDLEPEYIAVDKRSRTAFVSLQENNALAIVDIKKARIVSIEALGFKDHSVAGNGLDASDRDDAINIANWPVLGMYQPDSIATISFFGVNFVVSANEGDAREYGDVLVEENRVIDDEVILSAEAFPNAAELKADEAIGRLTITNTLGKNDAGEFESLYAFGSRSFSIWAVYASGHVTQVYDSGDDFEQITGALLPDDFNSTNDENDSFDNRSDNKGPEPEALTVGTDLLQTFSFIGLERVGGIMTYDITNPFGPRFVEYFNNRDFAGDPEADTAGDLGPEGFVFIPRSESPFVEPVLIVANEVSGSTTLYRIKRVGGLLSKFLNE